MPRCPQCKEVSQRRKDGECPKCGEPVTLWKKMWVRVGDTVPTRKIVLHFESLLRERMREEYSDSTMPFHLPAIVITRELRFAEKLLQVADDDLDVTLDAITELFKNPKYAYRDYETMRNMQNAFVKAVNIVRWKNKQLEEVNKRKKDYLDQLEKTEDVFND